MIYTIIASAVGYTELAPEVYPSRARSHSEWASEKVKSSFPLLEARVCP